MSYLKVRDILAELQTLNIDENITFVNENDDRIYYVGIGKKDDTTTMGFNCELAYERPEK